MSEKIRQVERQTWQEFFDLCDASDVPADFLEDIKRTQDQPRDPFADWDEDELN